MFWNVPGGHDTERPENAPGMALGALVASEGSGGPGARVTTDRRTDSSRLGGACEAAVTRTPSLSHLEGRPFITAIIAQANKPPLNRLHDKCWGLGDIAEPRGAGGPWAGRSGRRGQSAGVPEGRDVRGTWVTPPIKRDGDSLHCPPMAFAVFFFFWWKWDSNSGPTS
jgi:hypothetical protein